VTVIDAVVDFRKSASSIFFAHPAPFALAEFLISKSAKERSEGCDPNHRRVKVSAKEIINRVRKELTCAA